jgi:hypothetical protein
MPFPLLALEDRRDKTCIIDSETESEEFVSETEIRNRTQNWINHQDPTLLPRKTPRYSSLFNFHVILLFLVLQETLSELLTKTDTDAICLHRITKSILMFLLAAQTWLLPCQMKTPTMFPKG